MPQVRLDSVISRLLYGFVYGITGSGKTRLLTTLVPSGEKAAFALISAEKGGTQVLKDAGFPGDTLIELISPAAEDPFAEMITAVKRAAGNPKVKAIGVDGLTTLGGMAINRWSKDGTEKGMGWSGWGRMLSGYRMLEEACRSAYETKNKSVVMTAWEQPPKYQTDGVSQQDVLVEEGRLYIQGKGQIWAPGHCDFIARLTGRSRAVGPGKRMWESKLQMRPSAEWHAKTRFEQLPEPCPADFQQILALIHGPSAKEPPPPAAMKAPVKAVVVKK